MLMSKSQQREPAVSAGGGLAQDTTIPAVSAGVGLSQDTTISVAVSAGWSRSRYHDTSCQGQVKQQR